MSIKGTAYTYLDGEKTFDNKAFTYSKSVGVMNDNGTIALNAKCVCEGNVVEDGKYNYTITPCINTEYSVFQSYFTSLDIQYESPSNYYVLVDKPYITFNIDRIIDDNNVVGTYNDNPVYYYDQPKTFTLTEYGAKYHDKVNSTSSDSYTLYKRFYYTKMYEPPSYFKYYAYTTSLSGDITIDYGYDDGNISNHVSIGNDYDYGEVIPWNPNTYFGVLGNSDGTKINCYNCYINLPIRDFFSKASWSDDKEVLPSIMFKACDDNQGDVSQFDGTSLCFKNLKVISSENEYREINNSTTFYTNSNYTSNDSDKSQIVFSVNKHNLSLYVVEWNSSDTKDGLYIKTENRYEKVKSILITYEYDGNKNIEFTVKINF